MQVSLCVLAISLLAKLSLVHNNYVTGACVASRASGNARIGPRFNPAFLSLVTKTLIVIVIVNPCLG